MLAFSEPLNRSLTQVQVVDVRTGRRVPSTLSISAGRRVIVRPDEGLVSPAAYRVDWDVSTQDGHALEGSFGFGVRTAAIGGQQRLEQRPLARDGWLRVLVRGLFYGALLFVAGGLFTGLLLSRSGSPWGWLRVRGATDRDLVERAIWRRSRRAAWVAALGAVAVGAVETIDAAGTLDGAAVHDYLLTVADPGSRTWRCRLRCVSGSGRAPQNSHPNSIRTAISRPTASPARRRAGVLSAYRC